MLVRGLKFGVKQSQSDDPLPELAKRADELEKAEIKVDSFEIEFTS